MNRKLLNLTLVRPLLLLMIMLGLGRGNAWGAEVTDVLDRALIGITSTNYSAWSGKSSTSDAVYAGQSAGG